MDTNADPIAAASGLDALSPDGVAVFHISEGGRVVGCTAEAIEWWGAATPTALNGRAFVGLFFFEAPGDSEDSAAEAWSLLSAAAAARPMNLQARVEGGGFEARVELSPLNEAMGDAVFTARIIRLEAPEPLSAAAEPAEPAEPAESTDPGEPEGLKKEKRDPEFLEGSRVGWFELDFSTGRSQYSGAWLELLGYQKGDIPDDTVTFGQLVHPDDSEAVPHDSEVEHPEGSEPFSAEARMLCKDDSWRWMHLAGTQRFDAEGKLVGVSGVMLDSQERHELEEETLRNEGRFHQLLGRAETAFFEINLVAGTAWYSPGFARLLGYRAADVPNLPETFLDLLPVENAEAGIHAFFRILAGKNEDFVSRYRLRHSDGRMVAFEAFIATERNRRGEIEKVSALHRPGGEVDAGVDQVEPARAGPLAPIGKQALNAVAEAVVIVDPEAAILYANAKAEELALESGIEEFIGLPFPEVFKLLDRETNDSASDTISRVLSSGQVFDLDHGFSLQIDCLIEEIVLTCRPVVDGRNRPAGAVVIFRRPSEMPLSPAEMVSSNRMETLGRLACGIAHDFNNLLTTVSGGVSLAREKHEWGPLRSVEKACATAKNLARQLLSFSRVEEADKKTQSIAKLIREVAPMAAAGSSALVEYELEEDLHPVEIDGVQFVQVFTNLILNSIQMMPDNGRIWIRASNAPLGEVNTVGLPRGEYVRIDLQDNGPGIPEMRMKDIFDPFYSTRSDGTGLGLPMAKSIITQHGGGIEAVSSMGSGTTFTIFLPRASSPIVENTNKPATASFGSGRVLIVDDDEDLCVIAKGMLETLGYQGEAVSTASDALTKVRKLAEIGRKYSAVVLDMNMPGEIPGDELLVRLREIDPTLKGVVSSGYGTEHHWKQYQQQGFDTMLAKPYRSSDLGTALKQVIVAEEEKIPVAASPSGGKPTLRVRDDKPPPPPPPI